MARAAKKKREVEPLYMVVAEGGRLNPAFQRDQERLMSFWKGARLIVTIKPDGSRKGVRRWFLILGKAVKNGLLPWKTADAADDGLRDALDMWEPKRQEDGAWKRERQSLNDFNDAELDEKIELMMALIYKLSGVDPDDFKRELKLAGAGDEQFESDYYGPAAANDAGSATPSPDESPPSSGESVTDSPVGDTSIGAGNDLAPQAAGTDATSSNSEGELDSGNGASAPDDSGSFGVDSSDTAAPNSAQGTTPETGAVADSGGAVLNEAGGTAAPTAGASDGAVLAPAAEFSEEDRAWLKFGAHQMLAGLPDDDPDALRMLIVQAAEIRKVMPKDVSRATLQRMESMRLHCRNVCDGKEKLDKRWMAETAMAPLAEIEPKPVKTRAAQ